MNEIESIAGHSAQRGTEACRLLSLAQSLLSDAQYVAWPEADAMRAEIEKAGRHGKALLEQAVVAQKTRTLAMAAEAGRLIERATKAEGYVSGGRLP